MKPVTIPTDDFDSSKCLTLLQARPLIKGRRGHVSLEVLRRWARKGVQIGDARLILPVVRLGGQFYMMPAWIAEFERLRAQMSVRVPDLSSFDRLTPKQRTASHQAAVDYVMGPARKR